MDLVVSLLKAHWAFMLITVGMGGAAAYATGKAIARTWRPYGHVVLYMLGMAALSRFCHFALFQEPLLDAAGYLIDLAVLTAAATAGYRTLRTKQMAAQYGWLFEATGPVTWKRRA